MYFRVSGKDVGGRYCQRLWMEVTFFLVKGQFMFRNGWLKSVRSAMTGHTSERSRRAPTRRKQSPLAVDVRLLETRTLLSAAAPELNAAVGPLAPVTTDEISDGAVIVRTKIDASEARVIAPGENSIRVGQLNGNGLQFNLIPAAGMTQQSIDGFQDAADLWSAILRDDVMVNIDINFTALDPGVLAQAGSTTQGNSLSSVKTALASDAKSLTDATAVANLPSGSSLSIYTSDVTTSNPELDNNGTANNNTLDVNTTVAKAIGLRAAGDAAVDAEITFSSLFTWDFDRSDGISAGAFDFIGVVAHEIGHALGFVSGADVVDFTTGDGPAPQEIDIFRVASVHDLFRVSADSITAGADIDLRADTATKFFSLDGTTLLSNFSTGSFNGDGRQASHWKDNLNIGIMDPTAAPGEYTDVTDLDVMAFDAMGWDVAMDLGDAPDSGAGTGTGNYNTNLSDNGPRHLLFGASGLISDPTGAPKVFLGTGVTGELSALQNATATGDTDNGVVGLPSLNPGSTQNFTVNSTGVNAILNYFFDFNRDGDFGDAGESFTTTLTSTSQSVSVTVPAGASAGASFARFRISSAGGLTAVGPANDGEVEDYQVTINSSGGGNTAPSIGGAASNQAVNDTTTIAPFNVLTVTDPDTQAMSAIVRINNGTVRGDFTNGVSNGWTRSVSGTNIQYARTFPSGANIGATVQTAIRALVFDPRTDQIKPNTTEATTFNVTVADGVAAPVTNTATSVITTSVNNVPTIGGANPSVAVNDNATVNPFAALTVNDTDNQEMLAKITILNGTVRGDFTNAVSSGWTRSVLGNNINYVRYFSPQLNVGSVVQTAYRALTFQPRSNAIAPGTTEATDFLVIVSDGVAAPASNQSTRVTTTSVNNAPVVGGTVANQTMNDNQTKAVFSTVTVTDPDNQAIFARVTIPNGVNRGDFTAGSVTGWTRTVVGIDIKYERFFAAAANNGAVVQTAIRALIFQPRTNVPISTSETTLFGIFINDGAANTTNNGTSVITTGVAPRFGDSVATTSTILEQDISTVVVPAVKSSTSLLSRLLKKSR